MAQTLVEAGNSFELQCAPADARQYKLYARYGVEWPYHYGNSGYGLIFDMKVLLDYYNQHILSKESLIGLLGCFGVPAPAEQ